MRTTTLKRRLAMTLFLAMIAAASAWATDFIKDVMVIGGSKDETNNLKSTLMEQGWTVITKDLNTGASGDYIFLLYKAESNTDGINHSYITDFYIDNEYKPCITYQGRTYFPVPCDGGTNFKKSNGDLNRGAGGDYIYLYYTKNHFTDARAITEITFNDTQSGAVGLQGGTTGYDLNKGAGGKHIYMHLTTETAIHSHAITFADGTEDTAHWSITPVGGDLQSPTFDEGTQVTLTYSGTKVVDNVTVSKGRWYGDLSTLTSHVTVPDGMTLTGRLGNYVKVSIADGATVKLHDVTIEGVNWNICPWAGITCEGDATIVLSGTNKVQGFHKNYPGIFVPEGNTLTIRGNGSLEARPSSVLLFGGGIGGGYTINCGNIVIEGGTIVASGGLYAAGIGSGLDSNCGNITITDDVKSITACKGWNYAPYSIGPGKNGTCGTVTIGGKETGPISESPYTYTGKGTSSSEMPEGTSTDAFVYASFRLTPIEVAVGGGVQSPTWTFIMPDSDVKISVEYSCDVNNDGNVDVADIAAIIDVMAGNAPELVGRADVNGDGVIDVADIARIIDKMAGK
ncbi:MAG: dockerin type I repeat-containing protein [Prevotella sp.]|nr:dockerin type I repeat-containing protein [Prevotella sp.]